MGEYETKRDNFSIEAAELLQNFMFEMNDLARRHSVDPFEYIKETGCLIIHEAMDMEKSFNERR